MNDQENPLAVIEKEFDCLLKRFVEVGKLAPLTGAESTAIHMRLLKVRGDLRQWKARAERAKTARVPAPPTAAPTLPLVGPSEHGN